MDLIAKFQQQKNDYLKQTLPIKAKIYKQKSFIQE